MGLSSEMARRNALIGGGRPLGSITAETKKKIAQTKAMNTRIGKMADKLINAQSIVALGSHKMLRPFMGEDGLPHVETIRDEDEMQKLIDEGEYGKDYLIVLGAKPDWKAANAMLDRRFGKAKETIEMTGEVTLSLRDLAKQALLKSREEENIIDVEDTSIKSLENKSS